MNKLTVGALIGGAALVSFLGDRVIEFLTSGAAQWLLRADVAEP